MTFHFRQYFGSIKAIFLEEGESSVMQRPILILIFHYNLRHRVNSCSTDKKSGIHILFWR